jgi:hypothetical protein
VDRFKKRMFETCKKCAPTKENPGFQKYRIGKTLSSILISQNYFLELGTWNLDFGTWTL